MILKKHLADDTSSSSSATILGLKVVGGRIIESGRLGAIIEKVKKGSIADTIGRLRPGLSPSAKLGSLPYIRFLYQRRRSGRMEWEVTSGKDL